MRNFWLSKVIRIGDVVQYTGHLAARQGTKMTVNGIVEAGLYECVWFEGPNLRVATIKRLFLKAFSKGC